MLDADIAGAPVVNKSGQIIGVLTEADIIWKVGQCLCWPEGSCTPTAVLLLTI
jgi:predicted transcriptional regulator